MSIHTKNSYPAGTKVYCWQFMLPINGWIGGLDKEYWSDDPTRIKLMMEHCKRPKRMINAISSGEDFKP